MATVANPSYSGKLLRGVVPVSGPVKHADVFDSRPDHHSNLACGGVERGQR